MYREIYRERENFDNSESPSKGLLLSLLEFAHGIEEKIIDAFTLPDERSDEQHASFDKNVWERIKLGDFKFVAYMSCLPEEIAQILAEKMPSNTPLNLQGLLKFGFLSAKRLVHWTGKEIDLTNSGLKINDI